MSLVNLSMFGGVGWQFFDNNGTPLVAGKIYTYAAGGTTNKATYTDSTGGTAHTNPIILDAGGRIPGGELWLIGGGIYKFALKTSTDTLIATFDNINASGLGSQTIYNGVGTGAQVDYTLASIPSSENNMFVYINGVYQQKNTFSVVGAVLTFSQVPPLTSTIEITYF